MRNFKMKTLIAAAIALASLNLSDLNARPYEKRMDDNSIIKGVPIQIPLLSEKFEIADGLFR